MTPTKESVRAQLRSRFNASEPKESFVPVTPHPKQQLFLDLKEKEALFGGATGGGKSATLLMDALQHVDKPGYSALLLRRNFPDLVQEGGLISLGLEWLSNTSAVWRDKDKEWRFPSGARLRFGHMNTENDKYGYQGGEYQYIGFDEVTQFSETQYTYMFSRLRKRADSDVPLKVRGATNPGGTGGKWVYNRFIPDEFQPEQAREVRVWHKEQENGSLVAFVPSLLADNPSLDQESYMASLSELDAITRAQYIKGDWKIQVRGDILYTYSEPHSVISWSQFEQVFGERKIPQHWQIGVFQDWGTTDGHPCVTTWFATAGKNAPVVNGVDTAGLVFIYRALTLTKCTAFDVAGQIKAIMTDDAEQGRCMQWMMSHEASSERLEYNNQQLPFQAWSTGRTLGVEQLKNAFSLIDNDEQHPFTPQLKGHPRLMLIVDDEELVNPKTDMGLARHREEIPAYKWAELKSGEPTMTLVPHALFNDAVDTMRAAAYLYFPHLTDYTVQEKVLKEIDEKLPIPVVPPERKEIAQAEFTNRAKLATEIKKRLESEDEITPSFRRMG